MGKSKPAKMRESKSALTGVYGNIIFTGNLDNPNVPLKICSFILIHFS